MVEATSTSRSSRLPTRSRPGLTGDAAGLAGAEHFLEVETEVVELWAVQNFAEADLGFGPKQKESDLD